MPFDMFDGPHQQMRFLTCIAEFDSGDCRVQLLSHFELRKEPLHPSRSILAVLAHESCSVLYILNEVCFPIHANILYIVQSSPIDNCLTFTRKERPLGEVTTC
jgi:hypothetical protein